MGKGKRNENNEEEAGPAGDAPGDQRTGCHAIRPAHIPGRRDSLFPAAPDVHLRIAGGRSRGAGRGIGDGVQKPAGTGDPVSQFAGKLCQQYAVSGGPHWRRGKPVHCGFVGKRQGAPGQRTASDRDRAGICAGGAAGGCAGKRKVSVSGARGEAHPGPGLRCSAREPGRCEAADGGIFCTGLHKRAL